MAAASSAAALSTVPLAGAHLWAGFGALAVLAAACLVVSLVDHDTLYLDLRVFIPALALSWSLVLVYCAANGRLRDAGIAAAGTLLVILALEIIAWFYKTLRGQVGLGFGDQILLVGTVGIPAAVLGQFGIPLLGVFASMLVFIVFGLTAMALRRSTSKTPIAFVPFLSFGWLLALAVASVAGWTSLTTGDVFERALQVSGVNALADALGDVVLHLL